jgi:hypothetical protein
MIHTALRNNLSTYYHAIHRLRGMALKYPFYSQFGLDSWVRLVPLWDMT